MKHLRVMHEHLLSTLFFPQQRTEKTVSSASSESAPNLMDISKWE